MEIENGRLIKEGISSLGGMSDLVAKPMKQAIQRVMRLPRIERRS